MGFLTLINNRSGLSKTGGKTTIVATALLFAAGGLSTSCLTGSGEKGVAQTMASQSKRKKLKKRKSMHRKRVAELHPGALYEDDNLVDQNFRSKDGTRDDLFGNEKDMVQLEVPVEVEKNAITKDTSYEAAKHLGISKKQWDKIKNRPEETKVNQPALKRQDGVEVVSAESPVTAQAIPNRENYTIFNDTDAKQPAENVEEVVSEFASNNIPSETEVVKSEFVESEIVNSEIVNSEVVDSAVSVEPDHQEADANESLDNQHVTFVDESTEDLSERFDERIVIQEEQMWVNVNDANIRSRPSIKARKVGKLRYGAPIAVMSRKSGWIQIDTNQFVSITVLSKADPYWSAKHVKYVRPLDLNVRLEPNTKAPIVGNLTRGEEVSVRKKMKNGWIKLGQNKYVDGRYLTRDRVRVH